MKNLVDNYNERKADVFQSEVLEDFTDEIIDLYHELKKEKESFGDMGIDFEYPEEKFIYLSKEVKKVVDDKAKYTG